MKTWEKILIFGCGLTVSGLVLFAIGVTVAIFNNPPTSYPPPYWLVSYLVWCIVPVFGGLMIMLLNGKIANILKNYDSLTS